MSSLSARIAVAASGAARTIGYVHLHIIHLQKLKLQLPRLLEIHL